MEALGLHETNFNIQCYKDAIDLTSRWKVRFRQTFFSKRSPKGALQASVGLRSN